MDIQGTEGKRVFSISQITGPIFWNWMQPRVPHSVMIRWQNMGCLGAAWLLVALCLIKGVKTSGKVITKSGRAKVDADPEGAEFPWHEKPLNELDGGCVEYINDTPVVVAFDDSAETKAAMAPLAEEWV